MNSLRNRREAASHSADELRARLRDERPKYEQTKAEAIRIIQRLRSQLLLEESSLEQKADLAANRIKQAAVHAIDDYRDGMNSQEVQYLVDKAVTPIQKQFIVDANELQQQAIRDATQQAVRQLQKIWTDMNFTAEPLPITQEIRSLSGVDTGRQVKKRSDNDNVGLAIGAYLIGGLIAGPAVGILAAAASWFMGGGGNPLEDKSVKIKEQVRKQYNNILDGFATQVSKQYRNTVDEICNSMRNEIDSRLDTMERQLQLLIAAKESKERDAQKEARLLDKQYAEVKKIRANLVEVIKQ